jgi:RAD51-like protein 3
MQSPQCHFNVYILSVNHELSISFHLQMNVNESRLRLLVVDSISSLITPILGGSGSQGRALMVAIGYLLKKLAHEHSIAILVLKKFQAIKRVLVL